MHVTSQISNNYHRNPIISQYQILYTLSLLSKSRKSHHIQQIRHSELYLLPTINLLPQSINTSARKCNSTVTNKPKYGADFFNKDDADRIQVMLLQSLGYLDFSSCSVTLPIVPEQEEKRVKKCIMLYAQFTGGLISFGDSLVL